MALLAAMAPGLLAWLLAALPPARALTAVHLGTPATPLYAPPDQPLGDLRHLRLDVHAAEAVEVVWKGTHTLYRMADRESFENCDFTGSTALEQDAQAKHHNRTVQAPLDMNTSDYYASNVGAEQRNCKLGARFELRAVRTSIAKNPANNSQCRNFCADAFVFSEEDRDVAADSDAFYGISTPAGTEVLGVVGQEYCRRTFDAPLTKKPSLDGPSWQNLPGCYWTECSYALCPDGTSILAYKHWEAAACRCAAVETLPEPLLCNFTMYCGPYRNSEPGEDYSVCDDTDTFYGLLSPAQQAAMNRTDYVCDRPAVDLTTSQMRRLCCLAGGTTGGPDATVSGVLPPASVVELSPFWPKLFYPAPGAPEGPPPTRIDSGQSFTIAGGVLNADGSDPQRVASNDTLGDTLRHGGGHFGRATVDGSRRFGAPQWKRSFGYTPDRAGIAAFPGGRPVAKAPMARPDDEQVGFFASRAAKVVDMAPWSAFGSSLYRQTSPQSAVYRWGGVGRAAVRHYTGKNFVRNGYLLAPEEFFDTLTAFRAPDTARPLLTTDTPFARHALMFPFRCAAGYHGTKACLQCHDRCTACLGVGFLYSCMACAPGFTLVGNIEHGASCLRCGKCPVGMTLTRPCLTYDRECSAKSVARRPRTPSPGQGLRAQDAKKDKRVSSEYPLNEVRVTGARAFVSSGIYHPGDTLFIALTFSRPLRVDTSFGSPTLIMNTAIHHEPGIEQGVAEFVGGGHGETKNLWINNAPTPLKTGFPLPCRAGFGYATGGNDAVGRADPTAPSAAGASGQALCLEGTHSVYGDRTKNQPDLRADARTLTQVEHVLSRTLTPSADAARRPVLPTGSAAPDSTKRPYDDPPVAHFDRDEARVEQAGDDTLVFAYRIGPGERTPHLDYVPAGSSFYGIEVDSALQMNGATLTVVRGTNSWEPGRSNVPLDIRGGYQRTAYDAYQPLHNLDFTESRQYADTVDHHSGHLTEVKAVTDAVADFYGAVVSVKLPEPGNPYARDASERAGMPGSLSASRKIVVGHAFVRLVGTDDVDGVRRFNDTIRLFVRWSEPVKVVCKHWVSRGEPFRPEAIGIQAMCPYIHLLLPTGDITIDTTHGFVDDEEVFPTSFLITAGKGRFERDAKHPGKVYFFPDPPDELVFEYVVRRYDHADPLTYCRDVLDCLYVADSAAILRASDGTRVGRALPVEGHPDSLVGQHSLSVVTERADTPFPHPEEAVTFRAKFRYLSFASLGDRLEEFEREFHEQVAESAEVAPDHVHLTFASDLVVAVTVRFHWYMGKLTFKPTKVDKFVDKIRHDSVAGRNLVSSRFDRNFGTPAVSSVRASFTPKIISVSFFDVETLESYGAWEDLSADRFKLRTISCCTTTIIARVVVPAQIMSGLTAFVGDTRIGVSYDNPLDIGHCAYSETIDTHIAVQPWGSNFGRGHYPELEWRRELSIPRRGGVDSGCFYGLDVVVEGL